MKKCCVVPDQAIYERFGQGESIAAIAKHMKISARDVELRLRAVMVGVKIGVELCRPKDREDEV